MPSSTAEHPHETATAAPPRVVLLTSPGVFGAEIINRLAADDGLNLVGVGLTDRVYKGKGLAATVHTFVKRCGWRYFWYNVLHSNVAWIRLRISGRPTGLARIAGHTRLVYDVNSQETIDWLRALNPDFVASFFFNQLIGPEVRSSAKRGCINMHPSLLPALRGPDPIFRTLERGLAHTGHTIHEVADAVDGGHVLFQRPCAVPENVTAFGLYRKMIADGAGLLADWMAGRIEDTAATKTPTTEGDYNTFPTPEEVRRFVASGKRLITLRELRRAIVAIK